MYVNIWPTNGCNNCGMTFFQKFISHFFFFAFIDVYQNQIYHWNPETKLNQSFFLKILNLIFFLFDLTLRTNCRITVAIVAVGILRYKPPIKHVLHDFHVIFTYDEL